MYDWDPRQCRPLTIDLSDPVCHCFPEERRFDTNLVCTAISGYSDVEIVVPLYVLCFEKDHPSDSESIFYVQMREFCAAG